MMVRSWYGCTSPESQQLVRDAIASFSPSSELILFRDALALREHLHDEEPKSVSAVVGLGVGDVSDINLAAALVADGIADEVVLVASDVTGSLRSRAACAGISRVIDLSEMQASARVGAVMTSGGEGQTVIGVSRAEEEGARPHDQQAHRAPVLTFASGRGGIGKSMLVAVAAVVAGRWGLRVALLDLDLCCGNVREYMGLGHGVPLEEALREGSLDEARVTSSGVVCAENVRLWGPCARPEMAETVAPVTSDLIGLLARTHDLVLVDTSTTCTDAVAQAMQLADRLIVVHGAETRGLSSTGRISALAVRLGVARTRIARIENGCSVRELGQPFLPRAERGLETARAFRVVDGGEEVDELLRAGRVAELVSEGGDFAESVGVFVAQILEELGVLPDCDEANRLVGGFQQRGGFKLFGRRREAV